MFNEYEETLNQHLSKFKELRTFLPSIEKVSSKVKQPKVNEPILINSNNIGNLVTFPLHHAKKHALAMIKTCNIPLINKKIALAELQKKETTVEVMALLYKLLLKEQLFPRSPIVKENSPCEDTVLVTDDITHNVKKAFRGYKAHIQNAINLYTELKSNPSKNLDGSTKSPLLIVSQLTGLSIENIRHELKLAGINENGDLK